MSIKSKDFTHTESNMTNNRPLPLNKQVKRRKKEGEGLKGQK